MKTFEYLNALKYCLVVKWVALECYWKYWVQKGCLLSITLNMRNVLKLGSFYMGILSLLNSVQSRVRWFFKKGLSFVEHHFYWSVDSPSRGWQSSNIFVWKRQNGNLSQNIFFEQINYLIITDYLLVKLEWFDIYFFPEFPLSGFGKKNQVDFRMATLQFTNLATQPSFEASSDRFENTTIFMFLTL